ncbi:probable membrane-associated kinase regulator 2 [Impatiens glandulifera]|uniref:probable membrane-associated kinase regulator 2 n=1 Tax=Impatiens glandulifera TaxID=253017 RepID=UPI001FB071A5|nr:probable membrane-associated kinase regulator 2 [Impatiens glandulifera]
MESFNLLKYWRSSSSTINAAAAAEEASSTTTTIITAVNSDEDSSSDDEGPFFDLEFAVPGEENRELDCNAQSKIEQDCDSDDSDDSDGENVRDFEFALSSGSNSTGGDQSDPSDDLFFKGKLVSIDTSPPTITNIADQHPKSLFLQKSATRLRILMLKLKKSKCNENPNGSSAAPQPPANKFFTVKFKVDEVPIISLFTRDSNKSQKQIDKEITPATDSTTSDEKRLIQKYLNKVKPLYVQVSKRYADKLKFSGQLKDLPEKGQKRVYKHLGKSRSAVAASPPLVIAPARRCDDSLMDQQDGIQGAILHCKRSFNSSRDWSPPASVLARSVSDPSPVPPLEAPAKP